jgi:hypothetical protein
LETVPAVARVSWCGTTTLNIGNEVSQNIYSVTIARKPFIFSCRASWRPRLVDEIIEDLNADRSVCADLRRQAIEFARQRGNAFYATLLDEARKMGEVSTRSPAEYALALRRAEVAAHTAPWYADAHLTVGLLQYRTDVGRRRSYPLKARSKSGKPEHADLLELAAAECLPGVRRPLRGARVRSSYPGGFRPTRAPHTRVPCPRVGTTVGTP